MANAAVESSASARVSKLGYDAVSTADPSSPVNHHQNVLGIATERRTSTEPGMPEVFMYHVDSDGNVVEVFTDLDQIYDEVAGYFEPRPWHEDFPQKPKVWEPTPAAANTWGPVNEFASKHAGVEIG